MRRCEPYLLAELHREFVDPAAALPPREWIVARYADYVVRMLAQGHRLPLMLRHIHGLYLGFPGAPSWRRVLSGQGSRPGAGPDVLLSSLRVFAQAA